MIGRGQAVADIWKLHFGGFLAWLIWIFVHIFFLIGFRNRLLVMIEWAWSYFTYQPRRQTHHTSDTADTRALGRP